MTYLPKLSVAWVDTDPDAGEGPQGLYLNHYLVEEGDYYHDKIASKIEGWFACLHFLGWKGKYNKMLFIGDPGDIPEMELPADFKDLPQDEMETTKERYPDV